ncbi:MAG: hypothetical protein ACOCRO_00655 [Halanaerobiales bacterium]
MKIFIPEEYGNRTEYQLLKNWHEITPISFEGLLEDSQSSIMILVGRLINQLNGEQITTLKEWYLKEGNQLILVPAWKEVDLAAIFNLDVNLEIVKESVIFKKWSISKISYSIESNLQQGIVDKTEDGKLLSIHYKEHQYSGVLTVTTLPLLDFNLLMEEEFLKDKINNLLIKQTVNKNKENEQVESSDELSTQALYILLLSGAGVKVDKNLKDKISIYFYQEFDTNILVSELPKLIDKDFLDGDKQLTDKGMNYIKDHGYIAYLREIKRRMRDVNDRLPG